MKNKKYFYYTWEMYENDIKEVLKTLDLQSYKCIAPVAFGGLILGTTMKNISDLPTRIIFASSYEKETQKLLKVKVGDLEKLTSKVLVVDDISDTGVTLNYISRYLNNKKIEFDTFTLFYKNTSSFKPTYYLYKISSDIWIRFPWEHI